MPCQVGLDRPDVARVFQNPSMRMSGFLARVPVSRRTTRVDLFASADLLGKPVFTWHEPKTGIAGEPDGLEGTYREWLNRNERALFWPADDVDSRMEALREWPLISVALSASNADPYRLYRSVLSVISQKYPNWSLFISDDGSTYGRSREAVENLLPLDGRIRSDFGVLRREAVHVPAQGDFVALMDHDDELHPYALLEIVRNLSLHPDTDLFYTDEDKIDAAGNRCNPSFKPDFDPDLLLAFNYIGHLVCVRRSLVLDASDIRSEFDGARDWDLLLRLTERTTPARIQHVVKPLYHSRLQLESTGMKLDANPLAQSAGKKVIEDCLSRRGITAAVEVGLFLGSMRIRRELPVHTKVAVITRFDEDVQQHRALTRTRSSSAVEFYEIASSMLFRAGQYLQPMLWHDLDAGILVFVNCALDRVNHYFLEELISQCARPDCGGVTGLVVDHKSQMLTARLAVRTVPCLSPSFFAARKELVGEAGGLPLVTFDSHEELCSCLTSLSHCKGLKLLFTPYAIATLRNTADPVQVSQHGV